MLDVPNSNKNRNDAEKFESFSDRGRMSIWAEFWLFLRYNKKWWLLPIVLVLLALGTIILLGGTAVAPWIYTIF